MKKTTAVWTVSLLVSLSCTAAAVEPANHSERSPALSVVTRLQAPPQDASQAAPKPSGPQWKSRDEYDAYAAMANEKDPDKQLALAQAFIGKFASSDFISGAYQIEMNVYANKGKTDDATEAAKKVLAADPNNLDALAFLSYVFPFTYKDSDPDKATKLSKADADARHGLEVLGKLQKPANVSDQVFNTYVTAKRALFNSTVGFVALQNKNYPDAIKFLKASDTDNPSDFSGCYRLGLAYLYSTPPDYDNAIWYIARAVALANAAKNPAGTDIGNFLKRAYVNYHGTDTGLQDIENQAATQANPPDGFKISKPEPPAHTGVPTVDGFNELTFPLKLGGEAAQKQWDAIKGQPISNFGGTVTEVAKGSDPNEYLVHIAVLDTTKSADGYDIELKDTTQPNVKNLSKGDTVIFKGTLDSYVATPNMILTLVGEITSDLPDKPQPKTHPPARHSTTHASPSSGK